MHHFLQEGNNFGLQLIVTLKVLHRAHKQLVGSQFSGELVVVPKPPNIFILYYIFCYYFVFAIPDSLWLSHWYVYIKYNILNCFRNHEIGVCLRLNAIPTGPDNYKVTTIITILFVHHRIVCVNTDIHTSFKTITTVYMNRTYFRQ